MKHERGPPQETAPRRTPVTVERTPVRSLSDAPEPTSRQREELASYLDQLQSINFINWPRRQEVANGTKEELAEWLRVLISDLVQEPDITPEDIQTVVEELESIGFPRKVYGYGLARAKVIKLR